MRSFRPVYRSAPARTRLITGSRELTADQLRAKFFAALPNFTP
jgi:hypothetical protein